MQTCMNLGIQKKKHDFRHVEVWKCGSVAMCKCKNVGVYTGSNVEMCECMRLECWSVHM